MKILLFLKEGLKRLRDNPQLVYTVVIALIIAFSFIFISGQFITIARDAQERLVNVRVGSIQDAFAAFTKSYGRQDQQSAERILKSIAVANKTIVEFKLVELDGNEEKIYASLDTSLVGQTLTVSVDDAFLYNLALADPSQSFTIERHNGGIRFFKTARVITNDRNVQEILVTSQSLSEADRMIESRIRISIFVLILVLILILFLFFRHSRIIDYGVLYKKLREVDEFKDDFIAMASHELRTPLSAIKGYAELLLDKKSEEKDKPHFVQNILTSAHNLDSLVADILDVARLEQGRMEINSAKLLVGPIVTAQVESLKKLAEDKGLKIQFEIKDDLPIMADGDRVRQIVVNLIGNAIKYTKKGEIRISVYGEKNSLVTCVSDTGIGMTKEEQEKIFEKFYRAKSDETKDISGTGLGLWISRKLADIMNGSIYVESIKGVGTHIYLSFPAVREK